MHHHPSIYIMFSQIHTLKLCFTFLPPHCFFLFQFLLAFNIIRVFTSFLCSFIIKFSSLFWCKIVIDPPFFFLVLFHLVAVYYIAPILNKIHSLLLYSFLVYRYNVSPLPCSSISIDTLKRNKLNTLHQFLFICSTYLCFFVTSYFLRFALLFRCLRCPFSLVFLAFYFIIHSIVFPNSNGFFMFSYIYIYFLLTPLPLLWSFSYLRRYQLKSVRWN